MNKRYIVELDESERQSLEAMTAKGKVGARKLKRALLLLLCDEAELSDEEISAVLRVSTSTIYRVRKRFVEEGLEEALAERRRKGVPRKLDGSEEALLVALACSPPPEGRSRWTLSLLGGRLVTLTELESISNATILRRLKEKELKPWQKKMWCIPKLNTEFVAQMEDILDLYAEAPDEQRPIVNFDEAMKHMVEDTRVPTAPKPGQTQRYDYEYKKAGVANIFMFFDRHRGWRCAKATQRKTAIDFAHCMKELVDIHYPNAELIRVVMDNFGTHRPGSLYKAFSPQEARRLLRKLEFHFTPKHASWLNMVEIEIGVMNRQCLDRRIPNLDELRTELQAWEVLRNDERRSINWMFDIDRARTKLNRAYADLNRSESLK